MLSLPLLGAGAAITVAAGVCGYLLRDLLSGNSPEAQSKPGSTNPAPPMGAEPDNRWTERAAPLVAQLHTLRPDLAYLWGPRLSDFLAVGAKHRGTQKGAETSVRLRNYRVGLVLMDPQRTRPIAAILVAGADNAVAISLFEKIGLPFIESDPNNKQAVRKALAHFELLPPASTSKRAEPGPTTEPVSPSKRPAGDATGARPSKKKPSPRGAGPKSDELKKPKPSSRAEGGRDKQKGAATGAPPPDSPMPAVVAETTPPSVSSQLPDDFLE